MEAFLNYRSERFVIAFSIISTFLISMLTVSVGIWAPILTLGLALVVVFLILVFQKPFFGMVATLIYCFLYNLISRELHSDVSLGYFVEALYIIVGISAIVNSRKDDWQKASNDFTLLFALWFLVSVLQLFNPANPSFRGWLSEIRSSGFDSFLLVPIGFLIFKNQTHINTFFKIIIICSLLATINGVKQLYVGMFPGELRFLEANATHMIWGQLRVFSFYRDAGQFGASQAYFVVLCGILALGPFKMWKRVVFLFFALVFFYGMLISGTRGAFFVLVPGIFLAIFLFKNIRVLLLGAMFLVLFVAVLKYTHIGSSFSYVHRLRTAMDPEDPSLNTRFRNQQTLGGYIADYPLGQGLGVMGYAGLTYNADKFISTIPPDSYWVKVWGMYGIVGFTLWFCLMMYLLGKCCGIVWNIRDDRLRIKMIALTSGFFGVFVSSYGNEVINALPSSIVVYLSLALIHMSPEFDNQMLDDKKRNEVKIN